MVMPDWGAATADSWTVIAGDDDVDVALAADLSAR